MEFRIKKLEYRIWNLESRRRMLFFVLVPILYSIFYILNSTPAHAVTLQSDQSGQTRGCAIGSLNCGLVGYWTFNNQDMNWKTGKVNDVSGSANNGQLTGGFSTTTSPVPGKMGQALSFNGKTYVTLPVVSTYQFDSTKNFTITAWVKPVVGGRTIFSDMPGAGTNGYAFGLSTNYLGFAVRSSIGNPSTISGSGASPKVPNGVWTFVTVVFTSPTGVQFYVNSAKDPNSGTLTQNLGAPSVAALIGNNLNVGANGSVWNGSLDDVRVYNRALSAAEVKQLYLAGQVTLQSDQSGATRGCAIGSLNCGLVGYWTFNNQDMNWKTNTANDVSGNGYNALLVNMSTTTSSKPGKLGQGLNFHNANAYASTTKDFIGTATTTICAWVYPKSQGINSYGIIISNGKTGIDLNGGGTKQYRFSSNGGTNEAISTLGTEVFNVWTHLCVSRNFAGTANWYVNGLLSNGTISNSGTPVAGTHPVDIGDQTTGATHSPVDGIIDDVRVYNRLLSASEVKQLYLAGQVTLQSDQSGATRGCAIGSLNCGLVGYWTFNNQDMNWKTGAVTDSSGNANTGQLIGMSTTTSPVPGKMGQGLNFNGTNGYVNATTTGSTSSLNVGTSDFTVSAWIKPSANPSSNGRIVNKVNTTPGVLGWLFDANANGAVFSLKYLRFRLHDASNDFDYSVANAITNGSWNFVTAVVSRTNNSLKLLVNGVQVGTTQNISAVTGSLNSTDGVGIGTIPDQLNFYFQGSLDDVRVYNRALSAAEVKQLYMGGM